MSLASCYHTLEVVVRPMVYTPGIRKVAEQARLLWMLYPLPEPRKQCHLEHCAVSPSFALVIRCHAIISLQALQQAPDWLKGKLTVHMLDCPRRGFLLGSTASFSWLLASFYTSTLLIYF